MYPRSAVHVYSYPRFIYLLLLLCYCHPTLSAGLKSQLLFAKFTITRFNLVSWDNLISCDNSKHRTWGLKPEVLKFLPASVMTVFRHHCFTFPINTSKALP